MIQITAPPLSGNYRYERKSVISELTKNEIKALIKLHPAMFLESYPPRFVNNLYLDSVGMNNYFDNMAGLKERVKVRIRWYGRLFGSVEKPTLELKIKNGLASRKESFPLSSFSVDEGLQGRTIVDIFNRSEIPPALKLELAALKLTVLSRYQRQYFQSIDHKCRITLDSNIEFYKLRDFNNSYLHKSVDAINTVIELKYSPEDEQYISCISNHFPFRMIKNSKYINGIGSLRLID